MKKKNFFNLIYSKKSKISSKSRNLVIGKWLFKDFLYQNEPNIVFFENDWMSKKKQFIDFFKLKKVYVEVVKTLAPFLNDYHCIRYNIRQWELILYLFLYYYLSVVYDRWNLIKSIKKKHKLYPVKILSYDPSSFICEEAIDVFDLISSHEWNDWIISEIIKEQNIKHSYTKSLKKKNIFKRKFKKNESQNFIKYKNIDNEFFLTNFELPRYYKFKLNLSLGQFKFFYDNPVQKKKYKKP